VIAPRVRVVPAADEAEATQTVVLAFAGDPAARWSWPDARSYLTSMPRLVSAFGGPAFEHGSAYSVGAFAGVALWLRPGLHPDEERLGQIVQTTVRSAIQDELSAVFEQMAKYHPSEPHWYLPLIGVDPAHQGRGYGDALMAHALQQCDRDRAPAYLESSNPRNISLYRRHGFEVLGTIQVGSSPPVVPMLRPAR
jgi:ribosomal protein S18 acetylase RimI-like enzyme